MPKKPTFENRPAVNTESPDIRLGRMKDDPPAEEPRPSSLLRWQSHGINSMAEDLAQEARDKNISVQEVQEHRAAQQAQTEEAGYNAERDPMDAAGYAQHTEDMTTKLNEQHQSQHETHTTEIHSGVEQTGFTASNDNSLFAAKNESNTQEQDNSLHLGGGLFSRDRSHDQGQSAAD